MLFNSYEFIFFFLPLTLAGFYVFGGFSRNASLNWLILASLGFYAWWRPLNVLIIAPSIVVNYIAAVTLCRLVRDEKNRGRARLVLVLGIAFNVAFLGYFKYTNFLAGAVNDVFGTSFVLERIILPLGISFITFQKIAFLIDVHGRRVESFTLREYCLFVLFFPQLIAGPIVHYREMMPQFQKVSGRFEAGEFAVGLTLFFFGLFKKVVLADGIAPLVSAIYQRAGAGDTVSYLPGWMAAVGFTLQIYFDFSGYSDMAIGIGRLFGVRLPANFNSPLKATSIIDYWLRWHMTLTRFLTAYIYNPLVLALTRRRLARGKRPFGGKNTTFGAFAALLVFPTMLTMLVSGVWHGAGYLFIVWGALHGLYISVNHGWRLIGSRLWKDRQRYERVMQPVGFVITFLAVTTAMVFFRSPTLKAALDILAGMSGGHGVGLPAGLLEHLGPLPGVLRSVGIGAEGWWDKHDFVELSVRLVVLLFIALACPNTLQLLSRHEPALGITREPAAGGRGLAAVEWNSSLVWAVVTAFIAVIALRYVTGPSEFLYWQF